MADEPGPLDDLAAALGHGFARRDLLREALTHPSLDPAERGKAQFGYQRLEFLGDRVLGLVMAEWLFERYPSEAEGQLAKRYAVLVQKEILAEVASRLDLGRYVRMSAGEADSGGRDHDSILADVCEAVIAALYLDGGLAAARGFVRAEWEDFIDSQRRPPQDPKTGLQEWVQGKGLPLPSYVELSRDGPDHDPIFTIQVEVQGYPPVTATGSSKRLAEKQAAAEMLRRLRGA